jgi:hypothetical protein
MEYKYGDLQVPVLRAAKDFAKAGKAFDEDMSEETRAKAKIKAVSGAAKLLLGLPGTQQAEQLVTTFRKQNSGG